MARETELKLQVARPALDKAAKLPWLLEAAGGSARHEKLVSVYFDTPKGKLRRHGLGLRIRHIGAKRVQTIKASGNGASGPLARGEWEQEITGKTPDLSLAKGTALAPLATKKLRRKLRPMFETSVDRLVLPLAAGGTEIEVAIDRGYIKTGGRREPISEIELELKRGRPASLAQLARRFTDSFPAAYGARGKPERGHALNAGEANDPVRGTAIALAADASTADAFRTIAFACLDHALANERAVRRGDAEGVHQMRVGLRRLRAALSLFKPLVPGAETEAIKAELKWLTDALGPARELDVLIGKSVEPARKTAPAKEIRVLARGLKADRDVVFDKAADAVASERYRALGLKTALWIIDGEWSHNGDALAVALRDRPAADFAAEILDKRLKKIMARVRRLETLDPRRRHKLRIAVKKLRYGGSFFAGLFTGGKRNAKRRGFAETLKKLQGALGALNDFEAHKRIGRTIANPRKRAPRQSQKALAIGFVAGQEERRVSSCLDVAAQAATRLAHAKRFWA